MPNYLFALHKNDRHVEWLGALPLGDDAAGFAFAKDIARDIKRSGGTYFVGWFVNITNGERGVGRVPFDPAGPS